MAAVVPTTTRFYRYKVESLKIIFPNEGIHYSIATKLIQSIYIERDYDDDYFPIIRLNMSMDTQMYYKIVDNKTSVKFQLRLQKYIYDPKTGKDGFKADVFNEVFVVYLDENTPFLQKDDFKKAADINSFDKSGQTPVTVGGNDVSFFLFKEMDMFYSKKIVNAVITQATITDTIAYMLSATGFTKTLMTPLHQKEAFGEIIIPPFTLLGNLIYLERQFGFYNEGSVIFFDVDSLYIINKTPSCTAWRKGEYKRTLFNVKKSTDPTQFNSGSYTDDSQNTTFINIQPSDISVNTISVIQDQLEGNHRLLINAAGGATDNLRTGVEQRGDGTYKVMVNKYSNPFMVLAEKKRIETEGQNIQVTLNEIDVDTITPNKEFLFKFDDSEIDKRIGGSYRASKTQVILNSQGEYFKMVGSVMLKK
jgi:hypothetical protein